MTVAAFVLGCIVAFGAGWLLRDVVLARPRPGGDVDLVGARPREGWERRSAELLLHEIGLVDPPPLLRAVPDPPLRSVGVRRENGRASYSAAWLDDEREER